jgi:hypothetical protein
MAAPAFPPGLDVTYLLSSKKTFAKTTCIDVPCINVPRTVQNFHSWATKSVSQTFPLSTLADAVVGIDAAFYLDLCLERPPKEEPLIHAHGGIPYKLKQQIADDIDHLKDAGAKAVFIFNGLDHVNKPTPEHLNSESTKAAEEAWRIYNVGKKPSAVTAVAPEFTKVKYPTQDLVRWFQSLLTKLKVEYLVAPYSSVAQLSYMERLSEQIIDCIWGSTDYFLFNIDKVITDITFGPDTPTPTFAWVSKAACEERLKAMPDFLRDIQLLLGTTFTPAFPPLARLATTTKGAGVSEAVTMLNAHGRNVLQLCHAYREDLSTAGTDYEDVYKKAIMSLRHHIAIQYNGLIEPMNTEYAPSDVHDFVGQNLPPEMFFYLSRGIIGPEPLNWLTNQHIAVSLPPGVIDSTQHRKLVFEELNPIRAQTLMVMSEFMPNYYRNRKVDLRTWGDRDRPDLTINLREQPPLKDKVSRWKVKDAAMQGVSSDFSLLTCLEALKNQKFNEQITISAKTTYAYPALTTTNEVVINTFYRFLNIRGYINDQFQLTSWGCLLQAILSKLGESKRANDVALLAVELIRFGLLNGSEGDGSPAKSTGKDEVSRLRPLADGR